MKNDVASLTPDDLRALCQHTALQAQDEPLLAAFCVTLDIFTRCYEIVSLPHGVQTSERAVMEAQLLGFGETALKEHVESEVDQTEELSTDEQDQAAVAAVRVMMQRIGRRQALRERAEPLKPLTAGQVRKRLFAKDHLLLGYNVTLGAIRSSAPTAG